MDEASRHAATSLPLSGDTPIRPAGGGDLLDALDAALEAAWDDDALVEALCRDEGLVEAVADTEFAVEVLRSALVRLSASEMDRGMTDTDGSRANRIGKEGRPHG